MRRHVAHRSSHESTARLSEPADKEPLKNASEGEAHHEERERAQDARAPAATPANASVSLDGAQKTELRCRFHVDLLDHGLLPIKDA